MSRIGDPRVMTIIRCDWFPAHAPDQKCGKEFRSASVPRIVPEQAEATGWLLETKELRYGKDFYGDKNALLDLCPDHAQHWRASFGWQVKSTRKKKAQAKGPQRQH